MPRRAAWLTPPAAPDKYLCRAIPVPFLAGESAAHFLALIRGALLPLTFADNFEEFDGGLTADETAAIFSNVLASFLEGRSMVPAGIVNAYAGAAAPAGWLICDGSEHLQSLYPELYAVVGGTFGLSQSGYFRVPNLRDRTLYGKAVDSSIGDTGGAERHTLTQQEIPAHSHSYKYDILPVQSGLGATTQVFGLLGIFNNPTGSIGGNQSHNNMPPYMVLNFIISTGQCAP